MISNKNMGTRFEKEFAGLLSEKGFWVHLFQDNKNGQPCDVIAAKDGAAYLFDCKDCQEDFFPLNRVEENQYNAMRLFELTGNGRGKFVLRFRGRELYLIDYWQLGVLRDMGVKQIKRAEFSFYGETLRAWLSARCVEDGQGDKDADCSWK